MSRCLKVAILAIASLVGPAAACAQCGFAFEPAAVIRWYRSEGWTIPGLADAQAIVPVIRTIDGKSVPWDFPEGVTVHGVLHDHDYRVTFPEAIFEGNGKRTKMLARVFGLFAMLRWEVNGRPYAYSYELRPFDVACATSIDIIDEDGDGIFRVMTPGGHSIVSVRHAEAPPLPAWAIKPKT